MPTDLEVYDSPDPNPETGDVIDDEAYIHAVYDSLGIEAALDDYLNPGSEIEEADVEAVLARFSAALASAALINGQLDVAIVRMGVDHLTRNMNEVCSARYGYKSATLLQSLLIRAGVANPQPKRYVRELDDRYWGIQFPEEYTDERQATRSPDETEVQYLTRHIHQSIKGLVFAYFTHVRSY